VSGCTAALAAVQVADVLGNMLTPRRKVEAHLDRLGLPRPLHRVLSPIKLATAGGLVVGVRAPAIGMASAGALVAFYAAAATFHVRSGDHWTVAMPAVACGAAAAVAFVQPVRR
jgi:hypothetical protein